MTNFYVTIRTDAYKDIPALKHLSENCDIGSWQVLGTVGNSLLLRNLQDSDWLIKDTLVEAYVRQVRFSHF